MGAPRAARGARQPAVPGEPAAGEPAAGGPGRAGHAVDARCCRCRTARWRARRSSTCSSPLVETPRGPGGRAGVPHRPLRRPTTWRGWRDTCRRCCAGIVAAPGRARGRAAAAHRGRAPAGCWWSGTTPTPPPPQDAPCIHRSFEAQAARTPDAGGRGRRDESADLRELDRRANRAGPAPARPGRRPRGARRPLRRALARDGGRPARHPQGGRRLRAARPGLPARAARVHAGGLRRARAAHPSRQLARAAARGRRAHAVPLDARRRAATAGDAQPPPAGGRPDNLAYVIYTSGSTGTAQGRDGRAPQRRQLLRRHGRARWAREPRAPGWR